MGFSHAGELGTPVPGSRCAGGLCAAPQDGALAGFDDIRTPADDSVTLRSPVKHQRATDAILVLAILATLAVALASGIADGVPVDVWPFAVLVVLPGLLSVVLVFVRIFAPPPVRANTALMVCTVVLMLFVAEAILTVVPANAVWTIRRDDRSQTGADERSRVDVVRDLRSTGIDAYPSVVGNVLRGDPVGRRIPFDNGQVFTLELDGRRILPLANVSGRTTVYCNENGQYSIFRSDEFGFNNPPGLWNRPVDVALVGDSFVQGACVAPTENMAAVLRDSSIAALTVGSDDFGPLSELALLREYVSLVQPEYVVWVYYEGNDMRNLGDEQKSELLLNYLEPAHTQDLVDRQAEIDDALARFIDLNLAIAAERTSRDTPAPRRPPILHLMARALTLHAVRNAVGVADLAGQRALCCAIPLFDRILRQAKVEVEAWGGQLIFVYVPSGARYYMPTVAWTHEPELRARGRILRMVRRVGLPIIDMHEKIGSSDDPRSFYYHNRSHFGPSGYRATVDAILEYLRSEP